MVQRRFSAAGLLVAVCLGLPVCAAYAAAKDELTDKEGKAVALQEVIYKERSRGPIMVSVPVAYVFGLGWERSPLYCSPSVRASNASNAVIDELILGIDYKTANEGQVGSSVSRFTNIKIKRIESHFFNQLNTGQCMGLRGTLSVVRCMYATGEDCSKDVQAVGFGAIPLRLKGQ